MEKRILLNAKEKALDLANTFTVGNVMETNAEELKGMRLLAIRLAHKCVNEILLDNPNIYDSDRLNHKYWKEVQKELNVLKEKYEST